jgi:D-alanine-D-alanine ligase
MSRTLLSSKRRRLRIVVLVDPEQVDPSDPQFLKVTHDTETEHYVSAGLRELQHDVTVLPFVPYAKARRHLTAELLRLQPDIVFNLVEHMRFDRRMAANIPALLDVLGIPYTGSSTMGMLSIDKAVSKYLVSSIGFPVPPFIVLPPGSPPEAARFSYFPAIVKPQFGGASEGLTASSIVDSESGMLQGARIIHRRMGQAAICEKYIDGRELSVALLEQGKDVFALPIRETFFARAADGGPAFFTERAKDNPQHWKRWGIRYDRADLPAPLAARITRLCKEAFRCLSLSGYARIDLRLDPQGNPVFLEANSNPDIAPRFFGLMASWVGISYHELLSQIVQAGLKKC